MCGFDEVERKLTELLERLEGALSATERAEVTAFIDVGEYGVALETLAAICVDEGKPLTEARLLDIEELAEAMGIKDTVVTDPLRRLAL